MKALVTVISLAIAGALLMAGALAVGVISPVYGKCHQTIEGNTCPLVGYKLGGK
jgi:hypothetical protein